MPEGAKVIIRYAHAKALLKGYTRDFSPNRPDFHLVPADAGDGAEPVKVLVKDLKAIFFVRDFAGNRAYTERDEFEGRPPGRKLEVTFSDGEVMVGSSLGFDPQRPGFFLFPADNQTNNQRVFVVSAAVKTARPL